MSGDLSTLENCLAKDVVAYSDGGGKVFAALIPLIGQKKVITVFSHVIRKHYPDLRMLFRKINGRLTLISLSGNEVHTITNLQVVDGKIRNLYMVRNPDKLAHVSSLLFEDI